MSKNESRPNVVKRVARTVAEHVNVKKAARTLDRIVDEEAPRPESAPKVELSVVVPTRGGGLACLVRLAEMAGFGGVVVATLAAALVGRCRR